MNRRGFFKTITGLAAGVYAAFVPSKAKLFVANVIYEVKEGGQPPEKKRGLAYYFRGHIFEGYEKRVIYYIDGVFFGRVDLPTSDNIICFIEDEGRLYWLGNREIWEIRHTAEKDRPFQFAFLGYHHFADSSETIEEYIKQKRMCLIRRS
jgi:hypothetical protein